MRRVINSVGEVLKQMERKSGRSDTRTVDSLKVSEGMKSDHSRLKRIDH